MANSISIQIQPYRRKKFPGIVYMLQDIINGVLMGSIYGLTAVGHGEPLDFARHEIERGEPASNEQKTAEES